MENLKKLFAVQIIVMIVTLHMVQSQVIGTDCNGKDYLCLDDRRFQTCIDFGNGNMQTIDEETLPCPRGTFCTNSGRSRCILPEPSTEAQENTESESTATPESNPEAMTASENPSDVTDTVSETAVVEGSTPNSSNNPETTNASEDNADSTVTETPNYEPDEDIVFPQKSTASLKVGSSSGAYFKIQIVAFLWFMIM